MNFQKALPRVLYNYQRAIHCKRYQPEKLLGISYTPVRDFASKTNVVYKTPSLNNAPVEENRDDSSKKINYSMPILVGVGVFFIAAYTALKNGWVKVDLGPNLQKFIPQPSEETKIEKEMSEEQIEKEAEDEIEEEPVFPEVNIPEKVPYLLIGAGTAALSAFRAIKSRDPNAKVLAISAEGENPYMRPPLSKEFWYSDEVDLSKNFSFKMWNGKQRSVFFEHEEYYQPIDSVMESEDGGISVVYGKKVVKIDATNRRVYLNDGKEISYDKCLIATGGSPKSLPVFDNAEKSVRIRTTTFRNLRDFKRLHKVVHKGKRVAIIGGGFLGSELACALGFMSKQGKGSIVQIYPESGNMGKVLPEYMAEWSTKKVASEGVEIIPNSYVKSATSVPGGKVKLVLNSDEEVIVDHVIVAVGLEPNIDLAISSGLELDEIHGGFRVNAELEARSNLWVAGDAACFYDMKLGRRRVEHHDNAVVSGRLAGENMTGGGKPYWHQSMFWSDLGPEIGFEAIGLVDSSLPTIGVFAKATEKDTPKAVVEATGEGLRSVTEETTGDGSKTKPVISQDVKSDKKETAEISESETILEEENKHESESVHFPLKGEDYGKGIIFYLRDQVVVGILLWNVFNKMPIARRVIKEAKVYDDFNELAKLFNLHEE